MPENETSKSDQFKEFDSTLLVIIKNINALQLAESQNNKVFEAFESLIHASSKLIRDSIKYSIETVIANRIDASIKKSENYMSQEINEHLTTWKRNKILAKSPAFVKPKQKAIGIKWASRVQFQDELVHHTFEQCEFTYIPIIDTLQALFRDENFVNAFRNSEHTCLPGQLERFCCGDIYHQSDFFQNNMGAIQLLLAIDEFEPCSALKTKAGVHKICAVYMQIMNLPQRELSRLENVHLVALCCSENMKQELTSLDNVLEPIVADLKLLEDTGLDIGGSIIKGTLIHNAFDNLGGNELFGMVKSFNSSHYCRICDMNKTECSEAVYEQPNRLRNVNRYNQQLSELQQDGHHIEGVSKPCLLNNLKYFHTLQNTSVDLMHDVLEGATHFLFEKVFDFCINEIHLSKEQLIGRVRDFNYGHHSRKSKPSTLKLNKKNLNQNASQSYCLMVNLPFIFYDLKQELARIWIYVESLLKIMQILFSNSIQETDLDELQKQVQVHLSSYRDIFKSNLKPKHHFLTHYPTVIKKSGPVKNFWMMRMEAKHKFFTEHTEKIKNFKNITKSLAFKHQRMIANASINYGNHVKESERKKTLEDLALKLKLSELFNTKLTDKFDTLTFLEIDGIEYRPGLFLVKDKCFLRISQVISNGKKMYYFNCLPYIAKQFHDFSNSFEIIQSSTHEYPYLISYDSLKIRETFEFVQIDMKMFIKAETLDLRIKNFV